MNQQFSLPVLDDTVPLSENKDCTMAMTDITSAAIEVTEAAGADTLAAVFYT